MSPAEPRCEPNHDNVVPTREAGPPATVRYGGEGSASDEPHASEGQDGRSEGTTRRGATDGARWPARVRRGGEGSASDEPHASEGQDGRSEPATRFSRRPGPPGA